MLNSPLFRTIIHFLKVATERPFLLPEEVRMKKVQIESRRAGDRRVTEISVGGITARYRAVGELSELKATGRGNVRLVKALLREFIRNSGPGDRNGTNQFY